MDLRRLCNGVMVSGCDGVRGLGRRLAVLPSAWAHKSHVRSMARRIGHPLRRRCGHCYGASAFGSSAESVFRAMDLNGDGFVTPQELAAAGAPADIVKCV